MSRIWEAEYREITKCSNLNLMTGKWKVLLAVEKVIKKKTHPLANKFRQN